MKVITLREHIKNEIAAFLLPIRHAGDGEREVKMRAQQEAFAKLDPEVATLEDMDAARAIFGAKASRLECDECGEPREVLVRFGEEPDYEARWQDLCALCLAAGEAQAAPVLTRDPG